MTQEEHATIQHICLHAKRPWDVKKEILEYLGTITPENPTEAKNEPQKGNYTDQQRKSSWKYMQMKADQLNDAGLDIRATLRPEVNIPWTKDAFHDYVWIPIQKTMFQTHSMRSLKKDQPSKIYDVIERELAEKHGVDQIPFPNDEKKQLENLYGYKTDTEKGKNYPEMTEATNADKF